MGEGMTGDPRRDDLPAVGIVGTGEIGGAMVERMRELGIPVTAYARRSEVKTRLSELGVTVVDGLEEVAQRGDVVLAVLFTDEQLVEVAGGDGGLLAAMRPGSVLVSHTTGSPSTLDRLSSGAPAGVGIVDAPVSGSPASARAGHITLLVGGEQQHVDYVRPVLGSYGSPVIHVGGPGRGMWVKLLNNLLFAGNVQLAVTICRLGEGLGFDAAGLANVMAQCSGASFATGLIGMHPSLDEFVRSLGPFLGKDIAVAERVVDELGLDLGVVGSVLAEGPFRPKEGSPVATEPN